MRSGFTPKLNPLAVMKLFVLVVCDVVCWFVVCCLFV
jgi:hypothetical protein